MGIPAFGEWNYDHAGDGDDGWPALTQRFESATMPSNGASSSTAMGIPAFGEWNYDLHGVDGDDGGWSVLTQRFESAAMQFPFPAQKPCRKRATASRRRRVPAFGEWNNNHGGDHDDGGWTAAVNQCFEPAVTTHKSLKQVGMRDGVVAMGKQQRHKTRQTWVADYGPHGTMEPFWFRVVEAVDDDLYEVPPDMLCSKSMRRKGRTWPRSLLTRCFGVNCFA